jgi:hypothetical protein
MPVRADREVPEILSDGLVVGEWHDVWGSWGLFAVDGEGPRRFRIWSDGVDTTGQPVEGTWEIRGGILLLSPTFANSVKGPIPLDQETQAATLWYNDDALGFPLLYLRVDARGLTSFGWTAVITLGRLDPPGGRVQVVDGTRVVTLFSSVNVVADAEVREGPGTSFARTSTGVQYSTAYAPGQAWDFVPAGNEVPVVARSLEPSTVAGRVDHWYLCSFIATFHGGSQYGWVWGGFLEPVGPVTEHILDPAKYVASLGLQVRPTAWVFLEGNPGVPVVGVSRDARVTTSVKLRTRPSTAAAVVPYQQYGGESIEYLPTTSGVFVVARTLDKQRVGEWNNYWYYIRYGDNDYAWAYAEFIRLVDPSEETH